MYVLTFQSDFWKFYKYIFQHVYVDIKICNSYFQCLKAPCCSHTIFNKKKMKKITILKRINQIACLLKKFNCIYYNYVYKEKITLHISETTKLEILLPNDLNLSCPTICTMYFYHWKKIKKYIYIYKYTFQICLFCLDPFSKCLLIPNIFQEVKMNGSHSFLGYKSTLFLVS